MHIRDLQQRTQHLVSKMLDSGLDGSVSIYSLQRLLDSLNSLNLSSGFGSPTAQGVVVALVAFETEAAKKLELSLQFPSVLEKLFIQKNILERWYQTSIRRRLGVHATSCPYSVEIPANRMPVSIILLDEDIDVSFEKDCKLAYVRSVQNKRNEDCGDAERWDSEDDQDSDSEDSSDFVRVVLVNFQQRGISNKRNLFALTLCTETQDVEEACQRIVRNAHSESTVPIRIV